MTAALERSELAQTGGLSRPARAVLGRVARTAAADGSLRYPLTTQQLVAATGYSKTSIEGARRELVAAGRVELVSGCGRHRSRWRVLPRVALVPQPAAAPAAEAPFEQLAMAVGDGIAATSGPSQSETLRLGDRGSTSQNLRHPTRARGGPAELKAQSCGAPTPPHQPAAAAAPPPRRPHRLRPIPDRLRPLAAELARRRLDLVACDLDDDELELVSQAVALHGPARLAEVAYRGHRPNDPARSWRAWLRAWATLPPPGLAPAPIRPSPGPGTPGSPIAGPERARALREALGRRLPGPRPCAHGQPTVDGCPLCGVGE